MYLNFCFCFFAWYCYRSFATGLNICAIAAEIKRYKPIINKKKKKHDKIVLFAKYTLSSIEALISKVLINAKISHEEFVLMNNVLNKYDNMKEEIKTLKT